MKALDMEMTWDRARACTAAAEASKQYGRWIPQHWLELFFNAYEGQKKRQPLLASPKDSLVAAILMARISTCSEEEADALSVEIVDALEGAPPELNP